MGFISKLAAKFYLIGKNRYEALKIKSYYKQGLIHETVTFALETSIQNTQNVLENIVIGEKSQIAGLIMIYPYAGKIKIGKFCSLSPNARIISGDSITIGDRVLIGHNVNIIDNNSHSLNAEERHKDFVDSYYNGKMDKYDLNFKPIIIEDDVWIGHNATIMKGVRIGRGAVIGSNTVVTKNVEALHVMVGNPARLVKKLI